MFHHLIFIVEPTPLNPEPLRINAAMPYVPQVGSTLVFVRTMEAPCYEVKGVETLVHGFRWPTDRNLTDVPKHSVEYEDAALAMDAEDVSVETYVTLVALESSASNVL